MRLLFLVARLALCGDLRMTSKKFRTGMSVAFLLMATRRLEADPFLHEYYTEENYSPAGLHWVENTTTLRDVLARHYPALISAIPENQSAFTPRTPWPGQQLNPADAGNHRLGKSN